MIKLGYEIGTGKEVGINPSHLIATGLTNLSGKTTTLQALIKRSGLKAIFFRTKIGEKAISEGTEIPPFFRDRSDYEFVSSLIEAYSREKLNIEKGTLMTLCKGSDGLVSILKKVKDKLAEGKLRGINLEIYTRLEHYLENIIPQIQYGNLSKTLQVYDGINIMNLERFSEEVQSLIIQAVASEVLNTMNNTVVIIPEGWKFLPQKYKNPCKRAVESFIRQGATNNNFLWVDSQDMAGVDKIPLKQISTWILGYQSEINEVKHTLDQISLPKKSKPKEEEIMQLKKGHFILSDYEGVKKVYVQPSWMDNADAEKIARGLLSVDDVPQPNTLVPFSRPTIQEKNNGVEIRFDDSSLRKQINELRIDTFNKFQEFQNAIQKIYEEVYTLKNKKVEINYGEIIPLVLQKMPINPIKSDSIQANLNKEDIIKEVLARVPSGAKVYEVSPLEKIKKDFLEGAKNKILSDISNLNEKEKSMLKFLESQGKETKTKDIIQTAWLLAVTGSSSTQVSQCGKNLINLELAKKGTNGGWFGLLKNKISNYLTIHGTTEQEINQVYDHILAELL